MRKDRQFLHKTFYFKPKRGSIENEAFFAIQLQILLLN